MVNEVVTKFSFLGSLKPQQTFNANLHQSIKLMTTSIVGVERLTAGFFAWTGAVNKTIANQKQLSDSIGVSVGAIQELGYVAQQNGSSMQSMESTLSNITDKVAELEKFGSGTAGNAIARLGISFRDASGQIKSADQIFEEFKKTAVGLSDAEIQKAMKDLGIDQSLFNTIKATNGEFDTMRSKARELGVLSNEQAQDAKLFSQSLDTVKFALNSIQQMVATSFAPMMKEVADNFTNLLSTNRDWIVKGLKWLGNVLASLTGFFKRMWKVLLIVAGAFGVLALATGGFGAVLAVLTSPITLIIAGVVALLLIVDDLIVAMQGGQSVIRDFFLEFFGFDIVPLIQNVLDAFKAMWSGIVALFRGDIDGFVDGFLNAFKLIGNAFMSIWKPIFDWITNKILGILPDWALKLIGADATTTIPQAEAVRVGTTSNYQGGTVDQDIQIQINTSDPIRAGDQVKLSLDEHLRDAQRLSDRGGY